MGTPITSCNDPQQMIVSHGKDHLTLDDLSKGTFISGGSGSGKTTAPLKSTLLQLMRCGLGGIISTSKITDCQRIIQYAELSGRSDDLIIMDASAAYTMQYFEYMLGLTPKGSSPAITFGEIIDVIQQIHAQASFKAGEAFWDGEHKRSYAHCQTLLSAAGESVKAYKIAQILTSIPTSVEQLTDESFYAKSPCLLYLDKALQSETTHPDLDMAIAYMTQEVPFMDDRTWSNIKAGALSLLNNMIRGLFPIIMDAEQTNVTPEMTWLENKIIVLDFPYATYGEQGMNLQGLVIYAFMKKVLARDLSENDHFCFLICDEFQTILNEFWWQYLSVARSSRVINILATQSLASCKVQIKNEQASEQIESLMGNLATKIFLSHNEPSSNQVSADTIGKSYQLRTGFSASPHRGMVGSNATEDYRYLVTPLDLASSLKTGGPANDYIVEGYMIHAGRIFSNGQSFLKVAYDQRAN